MDKKLYERFHSVTKKQRFVVDEDDYTQGPLIQLIQPYLQSKKNILDVGCGTGAKDFYLAQQGHFITGIDISERAIESCQENASELDLSNLTNFNVSTLETFKTHKKFDLILCIEVIEHLENDQQALKKMYSLLKKNGTLVLSTPSVNAPLYKIGFLDGFDKRVGHLRRYTKDNLVKKFKKAGFEIEYTEKTEGMIRNFLFTSTLGGKIVLRLVNRFRLVKKLIQLLDAWALLVFGESDLIVIARKP